MIKDSAININRIIINADGATLERYAFKSVSFSRYPTEDLRKLMPHLSGKLGLHTVNELPFIG